MKINYQPSPTPAVKTTPVESMGPYRSVQKPKSPPSTPSLRGILTADCNQRPSFSSNHDVASAPKSRRITAALGQQT
eukprot:9874-Rhodomonas_salina.5